uniref:uncharacterized protein n=1 Tax=Myxine glutinosa TaxID=7769 RepID=UPI00358E721A
MMIVMGPARLTPARAGKMALKKRGVPDEKYFLRIGGALGHKCGSRSHVMEPKQKESPGFDYVRLNESLSSEDGSEIHSLSTPPKKATLWKRLKYQCWRRDQQGKGCGHDQQTVEPKENESPRSDDVSVNESLHSEDGSEIHLLSTPPKKATLWKRLKYQCWRRDQEWKGCGHDQQTVEEQRPHRDQGSQLQQKQHSVKDEIPMLAIQQAPQKRFRFPPPPEHLRKPSYLLEQEEVVIMVAGQENPMYVNPMCKISRNARSSTHWVGRSKVFF